jgi:hypothetical protein
LAFIPLAVAKEEAQPPGTGEAVLRKVTTAAQQPAEENSATSRRQVLARQGRALVRAIQEGDEAAVESAVIALSRSRRIFAPLVFAIGAFVMLFQGLKLLISNWHLTLVQILPAVWITVAFVDLKAHVLQDKEFHSWSAAAVVALVAAITLVSVACYYLNAVFAFTISQPGKPQIRLGFALARRHLPIIVGVGLVVGVALGFSTIVVPRWGRGWFALSLGIVVGVMMLTYVTVPARLVGIKPTGSRRDKMAAAAVGGALGALVCTPPYVIGRIGILMLGSHILFPLGIVLLLVGLVLQAGATSAVKAIKMSAKLATGKSLGPAAQSPAVAGGP